ncbi:unnamed protein product [Bathycoccus prasinos]
MVLGNRKKNTPADLNTFFNSPLFTTAKTRSNTTTNTTNENDDFSLCFPFKPSPNNASKPETKKRKRKFEEFASADDERHEDTNVFPFVANASSSLKKQKKKTKSVGSGERERVENDVARPSDPPPNGVGFAKGGNAKEQTMEKMVFDASKTTFTDFDERKKPTTTTTKKYKNFSKGNNNNKIGSKKKPPPFAAASSFNVAAAVAKKKAQIEVSAKKAQEVGFGSSARKPAAAYSGIVSSNSASKKGVGSSVSAAKKERGKRSSGFSGASFEVHQKQQQQHQPNEQQPNEFQKMIQKARENLRESSRKGLHSPQPAAAAVHHRPVFVAAQNSGKHQRFASPPSIPKSKTNITTTPKFPINQTFVSAAQAMNQNNNNSKQEEHHHHPNNNNNNNNIVDIVARAKQKTYLPSTAEKAKKKAKETYEKKRIDAERKEKLGQLRELDETLSSKTNIIIAPKDDEKSEKNKRNTYNNNNRVFGGAMTKAQKAHMAATEWEPL